MEFDYNNKLLASAIFAYYSYFMSTAKMLWGEIDIRDPFDTRYIMAASKLRISDPSVIVTFVILILPIWTHQLLDGTVFLSFLYLLSFFIFFGAFKPPSAATYTGLDPRDFLSYVGRWIAGRFDFFLKNSIVILFFWLLLKIPSLENISSFIPSFLHPELLYNKYYEWSYAALFWMIVIILIQASIMARFGFEYMFSHFIFCLLAYYFMGSHIEYLSSQNFKPFVLASGILGSFLVGYSIAWLKVVLVKKEFDYLPFIKRRDTFKIPPDSMFYIEGDGLQKVYGIQWNESKNQLIVSTVTDEFEEGRVSHNLKVNDISYFKYVFLGSKSKKKLALFEISIVDAKVELTRIDRKKSKVGVIFHHS